MQGHLGPHKYDQLPPGGYAPPQTAPGGIPNTAPTPQPFPGSSAPFPTTRPPHNVAQPPSQSQPPVTQMQQMKIGAAPSSHVQPPPSAFPQHRPSMPAVSNPNMNMNPPPPVQRPPPSTMPPSSSYGQPPRVNGQLGAPPVLSYPRPVQQHSAIPPQLQQLQQQQLQQQDRNVVGTTAPPPRPSLGIGAAAPPLPRQQQQPLHQPHQQQQQHQQQHQQQQPLQQQQYAPPLQQQPPSSLPQQQPSSGFAPTNTHVPYRPPPPSFGAPPPLPAPLPGQPQSPYYPPVPSQQQQPQPPPPVSNRNIDPGQMPRPSSAIPPTQVFETRRENTHVAPPPSENPIVVRDNGSAGPRYIRCSLNAVPVANDILKASSVPFVVVINPLALAEPGDTPVPVVESATTHGPLRCAHCKAYVNPYMQWTDGGRKMKCCFCHASTDVPNEYFSHLSLDGHRQDALEKPELCRGCVEFTVGGEYQVRPPPPPTFLFLIDATPSAVASGATAAVCASIAQLLDDLPLGTDTPTPATANNSMNGGTNSNSSNNGSHESNRASQGSRVGIVTYDARVQFYDIRPQGQSARMLVMSDMDEPYSPLGSSAVTVSLAKHKHALRDLLEAIPGMFSGNQVGESAAGPALKACVAALKSGGGRLLAFVSSLPHRGVLALRPREAGKPPTDRDSLEVMNPEGKEYSALAVEAADHQVCIDIFALTQGYVDLATLSTLSTTTSGSVHRYNPFVPGADSPRFHNDLRWALIRPQGFEAVARLRVSNGLAVENYLGSFHKTNATDIHFPALSSDHAVVARIIHEERLPEGKEIYLQYALLYSTMEEGRRVRVITLALPVTRSLGSVFRGADLDVYLLYIARRVAMQLPGKTLAACRDVVSKAVVETLLAYRKHCASSSSSGQLILPETLKLLPLYALGITKMPCFRTDSRADSRAVWMARILTMPVERIIPAVHPRLLSLHNILERPSNAPLLPEKSSLSAEKLQPEGLYLLENGYDAYIYVGAAVTPALCSSVLGVPSPESIDAHQFSGPPCLDTPLSKAVIKVLDEIRRQRRQYMHVRLMRRGHPQEAAFLASLIEDRSPSTGMSYVEYLCYLHRQIQNKMA